MIALVALAGAAWAAVIQLEVIDDSGLSVPHASAEVWSKDGQMLDGGTADDLGRWTSRELPGGDVEIRTKFTGFSPSRLRVLLPPEAGTISPTTVELSLGFGDGYRREDYWEAWNEQAFPAEHDGVRVWVTDHANGKSVMVRFVGTGSGAEAVVKTTTTWPRRRPTLFQIPESDWESLLAIARWGTLRPPRGAAPACPATRSIRAEWRQGTDYHDINQEICVTEEGPTVDLVRAAMRAVGRDPGGAIETR